MDKELLSRREFLRLSAQAAFVFPTMRMIRFPSPTEIPKDEPEIYLSPQMQEIASAEFDTAYRQIKELYVLKGPNDSLRTLHDTEKRNTSMEMQGMTELFAAYGNDSQTLERLFAYDDRYTDSNGLKPWLIRGNGRVEDSTVVTGVMMYLAMARLLSGTRQAEAVEILEDIKKAINPGTKVPQGFRGVWSRNLVSPPSINPYFLEQFSKVDPYWLDVASASRAVLEKINQKIKAGKLAYFPNYVDMDGNPSPDATNHPPRIDYDTTYLPIQQAQGVLFCQDGAAVQSAYGQLQYANRFFQEIIRERNEFGYFLGYDSERLKDSYNLDGSLREDGVYSGTAFTAAAAVASIISQDLGYRKHMFEALLQMPTGVNNFNDYIRAFSLLTLSGKMDRPILDQI